MGFELITQVQKNWLYATLGTGSTFLDTFTAAQGLNNGTKSLLLHRAVTQDPKAFMLTLDKVYSLLIKQEFNTTVIMFYGLKLINDLTFNNPTSYATNNTTLAFHLDAVSEEPVGIVPQEWQVQMQRHIHNVINDFESSRDKFKMTTQKNDFQAGEPSLAPNASWRGPKAPIESMVVACLKDKELLQICTFKPNFNALLRNTPVNWVPPKTTPPAKLNHTHLLKVEPIDPNDPEVIRSREEHARKEKRYPREFFFARLNELNVDLPFVPSVNKVGMAS